LDHATVKELAASMEELVCRGSDGFLDLSGVNFIDSTGVAMLMRLQNRLKAAGQHLILIASSPAVKRVLSFMRLQEFFDSAPDHDAAQVLIRSRARETAESVVLEVQHTFRALIWHGEVTAANVEDIWDRTQAHIEKASILQGQSGQPAVANPQVSGAESSALVIDLSAVRFIDSSGLGLMVRAKKCANQLGLTLRFTNPQLAVQNVIRLARLEKFLLAEEQPGVSVLAQFRRPPPQNAPPKPSPVPAEICSP
jgi:anti-anti-sigma factor